MFFLHKLSLPWQKSPAIRSRSAGRLGNRLDNNRFDLFNRSILAIDHVHPAGTVCSCLSGSLVPLARDADVFAEEKASVSNRHSEQDGKDKRKR